MTLMDTPPVQQLPARMNGEHPPQVPAYVSDDGEFQNLLDTSRFSHLQRVANLFANSQLVPQHFQGNVANCFIAMQMAMRLRVDPFMFMQSTYIVHGRPGMEAKLAIALINSSGLFQDSLDYEIEGVDPKSQGYRCRAFALRKSTGKRIDGPWVTWETVRAEGWDAKAGSKWKTLPGLMFQYRAATFFGRLHCPERLMGMQTIDELRDTGELAPVESGAVTNRSSLAARLTKRPVSEGQILELDAGAVASEQQNQPITINTDTGEVAEAPGEPVADVEAPATTGPTIQSWAGFIDAMESAAIDAGVSSATLSSQIGAAVLKLGKKGKESKIESAVLREWHAAFVAGAEPFAR